MWYDSFEAYNSSTQISLITVSLTFDPFTHHPFEDVDFGLTANTWVPDTDWAEYGPKASSRKLKVKNVVDASN